MYSVRLQRIIVWVFWSFSQQIWIEKVSFIFRVEIVLNFRIELKSDLLNHLLIDVL